MSTTENLISFQSRLGGGFRPQFCWTKKKKTAYSREGNNNNCFAVEIRKWQCSALQRDGWLINEEFCFSILKFFVFCFFRARKLPSRSLRQCVLYWASRSCLSYCDMNSKADVNISIRLTFALIYICVSLKGGRALDANCYAAALSQLFYELNTTLDLLRS